MSKSTFRKIEGGKLRPKMDLKLTDVPFRVIAVKRASSMIATASDSILCIEGIGLAGPLQGIKFAFVMASTDKFEVARSPRFLWGLCLWVKAKCEKLCYRA